MQNFVKGGTELDLNWLQSILYGLVSGLMDILPVSAQAHRVLLLKFFGLKGESDLLHLMLHLAVFAALYFSCSAHIVRMTRAKRLSRVPKRKRKRPLDTRSLMDLSMLKTMLVPVILSFFLYRYTEKIQGNLLLLALFLFLNGIILYAPQFLPTGNRDSRTLSRVEGLLMGFGGAVAALPGVSAMGAATSVSSVCGVDRGYGLNMALLMNLFLNAGLVVMDVMAIASGGLETLSIMLVLRYLLTAVVAFGGSLLGIRTMRTLAENHGFGMFGLYCFGLALFTFILNLMA